MSNRYYSRWYRMGVLGATDHLMMVALVSTSNLDCTSYLHKIDAHVG